MTTQFKAVRPWLDLVGCGLFAMAATYLAVIAPLTVIPVASLLTIPLALVGFPVLVVGLMLLAGFDRSPRRGIEGLCALAIAGGLLCAACIVGVGQFNEPQVLRELTAGAEFPWRSLVATSSLSALAAVATIIGLGRSRRLRLWAAVLAAVISSLLPLAVVRSFIFFIALLELPFTA